MSTRRLSGRYKRNPVQTFKTGQRTICTPMVRDVAQALCREVYVHNARTSNAFYEQWPDEDGFVETFAHQFIEEARKALAAALGPDSMLPESEKEKVFADILIDKGFAEIGEKGTVN